ncbi:MAG: DUF3450 domain-containing protein [Proteobacteria bacterium]|nr:DUF3450 domain-containing protein [Pseudomonadota bacterium]MBU1687766.1 DUF3450 domain-containing protein [Pseudomonadota bacterium]
MRLLILAVWALASLYSVENSFAESIAGALIDTTSTTIEIYKRTQTEKEQWARQKTELVKQKNILLNDMEDMTSTKAELESLIAKTKVAIEELEKKARVESQDKPMDEIEVLLGNLIDRIEAHSSAGLPMLMEERNARIALLRALLDDSQIGIAEKYRRTMEAVLIEVEYARTVEVYQQTIEVTGDRLTANVLRIGSAALFYQSPDGQKVGRYSGPGRGWEPLPAKFAADIGRAMEVARHQRAAEIIDLPVGRVVR